MRRATCISQRLEHLRKHARSLIWQTTFRHFRGPHPCSESGPEPSQVSAPNRAGIYRSGEQVLPGRREGALQRERKSPFLPPVQRGATAGAARRGHMVHRTIGLTRFSFPCQDKVSFSGHSLPSPGHSLAVLYARATRADTCIIGKIILQARHPYSQTGHACIR
jgi:hypothetical protein